MILLTMFILWVLIPAVLNVFIGRHKNRNWILWALLSVFFGWFSTLVLLVLAKRDKPVEY